MITSEIYGLLCHIFINSCHLVNRTLRYQMTTIQNDRSVADSLYLLQRMRNEKHGHSLIEHVHDLFLTLAAVITLSSLALFKYSSFFSENVNSLFSLNLPNLKLALPIGISFYTFQALTYVIDVYRGSVKVQPSFYKLLL